MTSPLTPPLTGSTRLRTALSAGFIVAAFGWIIFLPVSHNEILYPLFGLIGLVAAIALIRRNPVIDLHVWVLAFLIATLSLYGELRGFGNPDPLFTFAVYLAAPALYLTCAAVATPRSLRYFVIAAVVGTLAVSIVLLLFIAGEARVLPQLIPDFVRANLDLKATFRDGGSQARSWGLSSLAALGPLWMASLLVRRHELLPPWGLRLACAALALVTAVLSDRTAIVLVIVLAPFVALFLRATLFRTRSAPLWRPRHPVVGVGIAAVVVAGAALVVPRLSTSGPVAGVISAIGSFFGTVNAAGDADQSIRSDQAWYLIQGWAANPIFGSGFRAPIPGYLRASEIPWSLELQYHLLFFNVGLIGVTIALAALVTGLLFVRKAVVAAPEFMPVLLVATTAAIGMLIANATNPYLVAPGHQWAIFLPVAVAMVALSRARAAGEVPAPGSPRSSIDQ